MCWYRFFFGGRRRRQPQTYSQYRKARERRERYARIYAADHPKPVPETFQASIRLADGTVYECDHAHRSRSAAQACGERAARSIGGGSR